MLDDVISILEPIPGDVVEPTLNLAIEIAREGREGRRIGTLFTLGSPEAVLQNSLPLILELPGNKHKRKERDFDPTTRN